VQKIFFLVVAAGAGIGLMWPSDQAPSFPVVVKPEGGETVLKRRGNGHFYVDADVNGELVNFVVDTGAFGVILPVETARRLNIPFDEGDFQVIGSGASGPVRGKTITLDRVSVDGKEIRRVEGAIAEGLDVPLLGQTYLSRLTSVEMSGEYMRLQ
jgi:aspartyl protease family protein